MAAGESLHQLIKSLTSSEKRALTIQSTIHSGDKNYMHLFEIFDAMEAYNEESLLQTLAEKKLTFNLLSAQSYLEQKILDMLCNLSEQEITDARINKLLLEAQILEKRGFFSMSNETLDKAQRLAIKFHKHYHLIEILRRKGDLEVTLSTKNTIKEVEELFAKAVNSTQIVIEQLNYDYLARWLYSQTVIKRYHTDSGIINKIQETIDAQLLKEMPKSGSFYVQYLYYKSLGLYYYTQQEPEKAKDAYIKIMEIWEAFPEMKKEEQRNYIVNISNLISSLITAKEYNIVYRYIDILGKINPASFDEATYMFQNLYFFKLRYFLNLHQYSEALVLIPEMEQKLPLYEHIIKQSRLLAIYYNIAITYFLNLLYDPALTWLDKIVSITRTDESRKDIQRFARILQLAIYYQLGYQKLLENMIRSVYRSKVVQEDMQPFDKLILKYFNRLQKYEPNSKEAVGEYAQLKKKLAELPEDQHLLTGFEDFSVWLDMILEKKAARR